MTAQVLFNQLTYIDRLTRGGFSPDQARASAEALETAFGETVATKSDLAEVKAELKAEIAEVKAELKADISELKVQIASVKTDIAQSKTETLRWTFVFNLALVGAIFSIIKFFH
jgi:hypothetical protein